MLTLNIDLAKIYIFCSLIHVHRFCWWIHCKTQCPLAIQQQKGKIYANSVVDSSAELVSLPQNISVSFIKKKIITNVIVLSKLSESV